MMAEIDPRLELARRMAAQARTTSPRITTLNQAMSPVAPFQLSAAARSGTAPTPEQLKAQAAQMFTDAQRRAAAMKVAEGESQPAGLRGLVGDVLGNPIVKTALKPLELLDTPRRAVISGLKEGWDVFGSGDASFDDFMSQTRDVTFGAGDFIDTGNKWLDRALGFVGDVALDPLTYATFGANQVAGASGRMAMARRALTLNMGNDKAAAFARGGRAAATAEDLARLSYNRSGVYFFGKRLFKESGGIRVPGTGFIGEASEKGLMRLRLAASETALGTYAQKVFTPQVNREARIKLARGEVVGEDAARLIRVVTSRDAQRAAQGEAIRLSTQELATLSRTSADPAYRGTVRDVLEGARPAVNPAEAAAASAWKLWFKQKLDQVNGFAKTVDAEAGFGEVPDYFPWIITDKVREESLGQSASKFAGEVKKGFDDGDPLGVFKQSEIRSKVMAGEKVEWFGTELTPADLNTSRLNELARKGGFDGDYYETDILKVADIYAREHAQQMGLLTRYKDLLDGGVFDKLDTHIKDVTVVDHTAVNAQKRVVEEADTGRKEAFGNLQSTLKKSVDTLNAREGALTERIGRVGEIIDNAGDRALGQADELVVLERELFGVEEQIQREMDRLQSMFNGDPGPLIQVMTDDLRKVKRMARDYRNALVEAQNTEAALGRSASARTGVESRLRAQAEELDRLVSELDASHKMMVEFNAQLDEGWDTILSGRAIKGQPDLNTTMRMAGFLPATQGSRQAAAKAATESGSLVPWIKKNITSKEWFGKVNKKAAVAKTTVAEMTDSKAARILVDAAGGNAPLGDVRAAAMWMMIRDEKLYGEVLPEPLARLHFEMFQKLDEAQEAQEQLRKLAEFGKTGRSRPQLEANITGLEKVFDETRDDVATLTALRQALADGEFKVPATREMVEDDNLVSRIQDVPEQTIALDDAAIERLSGAIEELESKVYDFNGQKLYLADFEEGGKAYKRLLRSQERVRLTRGESTVLADAPAKVAADLADLSAQYRLISEVHRNFFLMSERLAPFGQVPSERMMREIVNKSSARTADMWDARLGLVAQARSEIDSVRVRYAELTDSLPPSQALRQALDESAAAEGGGALASYMAPIIGVAEDPAQMWKRMGRGVAGPNAREGVFSKELLDKYVESTIKPWWAANFPGERFGVNKARTRLNELKALPRSPFHPNATQSDVSNFFTSLVGGEVRGVGQSVVRGYKSSQRQEVWFRTIPGTIDEEIARASRNLRIFTAAQDPNVDVNMFLADPSELQDVPSMYAMLLRSTADRLDAAAPKAAAARSAGEVAVTKAEEAAAEAAALAARNNALAPNGNFRNSKPIPEQDSATVRMIRSDVDKLNRRRESIAYQQARADQELHEALISLSNHDLWRFQSLDGSAGFYVNGGAVQQPLDPAILQAAQSSDAVGRRVSELMEQPDFKAGRARIAMSRPDPDAEPALFLVPLAEAEIRLGGDAVRMPDGSVLSFTREEAESLYRAPISAEEIRAARSELGGTAQRLGALAKRRAEVEDGLRTVQRSTYSNRGGLVKQWATTLGEIDDEIAALSRRAEELRFELRVRNPETQQVALEKARILVHGEDGNGGWFKNGGDPNTTMTTRRYEDASEISARDRLPGERKAKRSQSVVDKTIRTGTSGRGAKTVDPAIVAQRVSGQTAAHEASESGKFLQEVSDLEQAAGVRQYRSWLREGDEASKLAAKMRREADEVTGTAKWMAPNNSNRADWEAREFTPEELAAMPEGQVRDAVGRITVNQNTATGQQFGAGGLNDMAAEIAASPQGALPLDQLPDLTAKMREVADTAAATRPPVTPLLSESTLTGQLADATARQQKNTARLEVATEAKAGVDAAKEAATARREAIAAKLDGLTARQRQLVDQIGTAREDIISDASDNLAGLRPKQDQLIDKVWAAQDDYDSTLTVIRKADEVNETIVPQMQKRLEVVKAALGSDAPKIGKKKLNADEMDAARQWMRDSQSAVRALTADPNDPAARLLAQASTAESQWIMSNLNYNQQKNILTQLQKGQVVPEFSVKARQGWAELSALGLPGLQTTDEIKTMLVNMQKMETPGFAREVNQLMGGYTRFFRSYATLSPGFHVRNTMSNTFMLVASGSSPKQLKTGFGLWKSLQAAEKEGKTLAQWLDTVPSELRGKAEQAAKSMYAIGGGRTSEQLEGTLLREGSRINNNKALRTSRNIGQTVESSAHFMLGYDSAAKGMDFFESTARVKRYLFDYQDISSADMNIKSVVPFWIWMSRNLPLQIVNQWANPKAYQIYGSFMRNIGEDDSGELVPSWLKEQGAAKIGVDTYLAPDMPMNRIQDQLAEFGDPARLLSYVNPGLRAPLEALGNRQLYNNVPFSSKPEGVALGPASGAIGNLLEGMGLAQRNADGEIVVDPRLNYMIRNMVPPLAQSERLLPTSDKGQDRAPSNRLNYFGIPIREVTVDMRKSEAMRRQMEMERMATAARALGFTP